GRRSKSGWEFSARDPVPSGIRTVRWSAARSRRFTGLRGVPPRVIRTTRERAMEDDETFMRRAIELARLSLGETSPNPNVGCVIVTPDGRIAGEGRTAPAGGPHAEVRALEQAGEAACGATAYVTLEPCDHTGRTGPCSRALVAAGVARVV